MAKDITVESRTQRIHVSRASGAVSVENSGPQGPAGPSAANLIVGAGVPEGSVTAGVGTIYMNTTGGTNTTMYVKESGTGNTGWVAK